MVAHLLFVHPQMHLVLLHLPLQHQYHLALQGLPDYQALTDVKVLQGWPVVLGLKGHQAVEGHSGHRGLLDFPVNPLFPVHQGHLAAWDYLASLDVRE